MESLLCKLLGRAFCETPLLLNQNETCLSCRPAFCASLWEKKRKEKLPHLPRILVSKLVALSYPSTRGSMTHWTGFSAFQLRCEEQQWTILADEKDARPFWINDACDPKLPEWLYVTRWGDWGYSTWCPDLGTAIKEAGNSKSRGWRRINGMDYNQLTETWWIVFELTLCAEQVCGLMNGFKMTCNIERKGVTSWRISEDIFIPRIQANGGLVHKHIAHGWGTAIFHNFNNFTIGLSIFKGDCTSCKRFGPLCARQCAQCWNNKVVPPAPPLVLAIGDESTSAVRHNKIPRQSDS